MPSRELLSGAIARLSEVRGCTLSCAAPHAHGLPYLEIIVSGGYVQRWGRRHAQRVPGQAYLMGAQVEHSDHFGADTRSFALDYLRAAEAEALARRGVAVLPLAWPRLDELAAELAAPDDLSPLWLDAWAGDGLLQALRAPAANEAALPPAWLRRVRERLQDDAGPVHTLAALAGEAQVHPAHLAREFRRAYGLPVVQFQRQRRLQAAAEALARGEPVAQWPCKPATTRRAHSRPRSAAPLASRRPAGARRGADFAPSASRLRQTRRPALAMLSRRRPAPGPAMTGRSHEAHLPLSARRGVAHSAPAGRRPAA